MTQPASDFQARLQALRESQAAQTAQAPTPTPVVNSAPAPEKGTLDDGAKADLRQLDLLPIYKRWFNPISERQGGNDEVNLSCFNTSFHANGDKNPQFGINTRTNLYYCHACGVAGDIIDLAANYYGYAGSDFRCEPKDVHEVVRKAGEELCHWAFRRTKAGWQRLNTPPVTVSLPGAPAGDVHGQSAAGSGSPDTDSHGAPVPGGVQPAAAIPGGGAAAPVPPVALGPAPAAPPAAPGTLVLASFAPKNTSATPNLAGWQAPVTPQVSVNTPVEQSFSEAQTEEQRIMAANFGLDWRSFVPENTPLRNYLELVTRDDSPEEYHFWNFMSLIGLTIGKKAFIPDGKAVFGNIFTCIIGRTGIGKSRSEGFISTLIGKASKFDEEDVYTTGIRMVDNPGSGEYLMQQFNHEIPDPTAPPGTKNIPKIKNESVKALVRYQEMSTMISKASGKGSTISQTVISLYDCPDHIGGGSLTNGTYGADNPFACVATTTQLDLIRKLVSGDDVASGFLNRWLFVIGPPKPVQAFTSLIDVTPIVPDVKRIQGWAERRNRLNKGWHWYEDDAKDEAIRFLTEVAAPLERESAILARSMLTFKKLCLLFSANMLEDNISLAAVEQAKIAFNYLVDCLKHIGVRIAQSDMGEFEEAIFESIRKTGAKGQTAAQVRKDAKRKNGEWTTTVVDRMLKNLIEAEMIEFRPIPHQGGPGAPKKRYFMMEGEQ